MSEIEELRADVERLRAQIARGPRVEINSGFGKPTTCRVWVGDTLRFDGVSWAGRALSTEEASDVG